MCPGTARRRAPGDPCALHFLQHGVRSVPLQPIKQKHSSIILMTDEPTSWETKLTTPCLTLCVVLTLSATRDLERTGLRRLPDDSVDKPHRPREIWFSSSTLTWMRTTSMISSWFGVRFRAGPTFSNKCGSSAILRLEILPHIG